jgi:hypothetical protein
MQKESTNTGILRSFAVFCTDDQMSFKSHRPDHPISFESGRCRALRMGVGFIISFDGI